MAHIVFTSYAQLDRDRYLERFVEELRKELQGIVVGRVDDDLLRCLGRCLGRRLGRHLGGRMACQRTDGEEESGASAKEKGWHGQRLRCKGGRLARRL